MSGFTGFSVGIVRGTCCYIPIKVLIQAGKRRINTLGRAYQTLIASTGQPPLLDKEKLDEILEHHNE